MRTVDVAGANVGKGMGKGKDQSRKSAVSEREAPPVVLLGGPTGSGKSALALAIAEEFGGAVVNADSMQIYRDLRILTDRPGPDEEARVPHRLFGVLDGADPCSVGRWYGLAGEALADLARGGCGLAVLVGGTGLYLKAAEEGLAPVPEVPAGVRARMRQRLDAVGEAAFREELRFIDPAAAVRIASGDRQRLLRAREVAEATGRPLADWQAEQALPPLAAARIGFRLLPPRAELYAACDARYLRMIEAGAVEEVEALLARNLEPGLPVKKAVGVREIAAYLQGGVTREEMIARGQRATRRYAKRQYTWFRHQMTSAEPIYEKFSESLFPEIFTKIRQFLLTVRG